MKQHREENTRLKRLVAELSLDKTMLQDELGKKVLKPAGRHPIVDHLRQQYRASGRHYTGGMAVLFNLAHLSGSILSMLNCVRQIEV